MCQSTPLPFSVYFFQHRVLGEFTEFHRVVSIILNAEAQRRRVFVRQEVTEVAKPHGENTETCGLEHPQSHAARLCALLKCRQSLSVPSLHRQISLCSSAFIFKITPCPSVDSQKLRVVKKTYRDSDIYLSVSTAQHEIIRCFSCSFGIRRARFPTKNGFLS